MSSLGNVRAVILLRAGTAREDITPAEANERAAVGGAPTKKNAG
jgi:hypothetical protein